LFFPRGRLFFISSMIILHTISYLSMGINFMGSIIILLLCFDINALFRKSIVYYDQDCGFCTKSINIIKSWNYFNLLSFQPLNSLRDGEKGFSISRLKKEIGLIEENGDIYYGTYAFEKIFEKVPVFYPIAILYKIPLVIYVADFIYDKIAKNRYLLSDTESCKIE